MITQNRIAVFLQEALYHLSGFHRGFPLEQRVYNILAFSVIIFGFLVGLLNSFVGIHWMTTVAGFAGSVIAAGLFYVSRIRGQFSGFTVYSMMFSGIVILGTIYRFDGGSQGAWIFGTLALIIVFVTISPKETQGVVLLVWLLFVLIMFTIEYFNADWVMSYNTRRGRLLDMMITFTYTVSLMALTIMTFKRSYNAEREKVRLQNEELERKNQQVELLMKELNHRIKNNLQVVMSLLNLQSARIRDPDARNALLDGRSRLLSMALIHQKLYQNEQLTEVNMKEYIGELADHIVMTNRSMVPNDFLSLHMENLVIKVEHAVPIGMILNELVTNAVKHAFTNESSNDRISIQFFRTVDRFSLAVSDNGKGCINPPNRSFGLQLVQSLVEQLEGSMRITSDKGTVITIDFSVPCE